MVADRERNRRLEGHSRPASEPGAAEQQDLTHVVYRFFDRAGELLYVGITMQLPPRRFAGHRRTQAWWKEVVRIEIEVHADRSAARRAELTAIQTERPRYNIAGTSTHDPLPDRAPPRDWPGDPSLAQMTIDEMVAWVAEVREQARTVPRTHSAELRRRGWTWAEIGKAVGVEASTAHGWAQPYL